MSSHRKTLKRHHSNNISETQASVSRTLSRNPSRSEADGSTSNGPKKLRREPSDFSNIFDSINSASSSNASSPSPKKKLVRRMLSRTTDSSSGSFASMSSVDNQEVTTQSQQPAQSVENTKPLRTPSPRNSPPPDSSPTPKRQLGSVERTYAGMSRSFLFSIPAEGISISLDGQIESNSTSQESYLDMRLRWGLDTEDVEDNSLENENPTTSDSNKPLASLTDLRSKGESRRFLDEVGFLFEGLQVDAADALKRSSALELVARLEDQEFLRKAKAANFVSRAWDALRLAGAGDGDMVLDCALCYFVAQLVDDSSTVQKLLQKQDLLSIFRDLNQRSQAKDYLQDENYQTLPKLSHIEKAQITKLYHMIMQNSKIMAECKTLSMQSLITRSLNVFSIISSSAVNLTGENILEDSTHYINTGSINCK